MKMLNVEHLVSLKKCVYNQRQIESFDLIEGDWIYISGDIEFAQLVYQILTVQTIPNSGDILLFGHKNLSELKGDSLLDIRKAISYLPNNLNTQISDQDIVNNIGLINNIKSSESSRIFNELKSELIYGEKIIESNEVKHLFKALSSNPKLLFIDFSFDKFDDTKIKMLLDPLFKYVMKKGLAVVFGTNNPSIKKLYQSRIYNTTENLLKESF